MANAFFYAIAALIIGIVIFYRGFKNWHIKRLIENTPTSSIRSIAMGFVEVAGTVSKPLDKFLKGPFTDQNCVYYEYRIDEKRTDSKGRTYWATIKSGNDSVPFYVKDKTSSVLVDPKGAQIDLPPDADYKPTHIPPKIKQFCAKNNVATYGLLWDKTLRFVETHLAPNDKIFVLGTAGDNPFVKEATAVQGVEDIMIQKGKKPFYISDTDEKGVLTNFFWKVHGGVFGGGVLIILALALLLWQVGMF